MNTKNLDDSPNIWGGEVSGGHLSAEGLLVSIMSTGSCVIILLRLDNGVWDVDKERKRAEG